MKNPRLGGRGIFRLPSWLPNHVVRLLVVLVLLAGGLLFARASLPPEMKDRKVQQENTVAREIAHPVKYAGAQACGDCHDDKVQAKAGGYHRNLSCETCHGPAGKHVEDPLSFTPPAPRDRQFCPKCHAYNLSRPLGFPQVNPVTHNPMKACIECHEPHDPKPPTGAPGECRACHNDIQRLKDVSPHALLECTTCHEAPEEHKLTPRSVRPSKPTTREFCGTCHARGAKKDDVPKVDMTTHGAKYMCWQCHYPHMPQIGGDGEGDGEGHHE